MTLRPIISYDEKNFNCTLNEIDEVVKATENDLCCVNGDLSNKIYSKMLEDFSKDEVVFRLGSEDILCKSSIMSPTRARKHFKGDQMVLNEKNDFVVIVDTSKSVSPYKYPVEKPNYEKNSLLQLNDSPKIMVKMANEKKTVVTEERLELKVNNDKLYADYWKLIDDDGSLVNCSDDEIENESIREDDRLTHDNVTLNRQPFVRPSSSNVAIAPLKTCIHINKYKCLLTNNLLNDELSLYNECSNQSNDCNVCISPESFSKSIVRDEDSIAMNKESFENRDGIFESVSTADISFKNKIVCTNETNSFNKLFENVDKTPTNSGNFPALFIKEPFLGSEENSCNSNSNSFRVCDDTEWYSLHSDNSTEDDMVQRLQSYDFTSDPIHVLTAGVKLESDNTSNDEVTDGSHNYESAIKMVDNKEELNAFDLLNNNKSDGNLVHFCVGNGPILPDFQSSVKQEIIKDELNISNNINSVESESCVAAMCESVKDEAPHLLPSEIVLNTQLLFSECEKTILRSPDWSADMQIDYFGAQNCTITNIENAPVNNTIELPSASKRLSSDLLDEIEDINDPTWILYNASKTNENKKEPELLSHDLNKMKDVEANVEIANTTNSSNVTRPFHNILDINEIRKGFLKPKVQEKIVAKTKATKKDVEITNATNSSNVTRPFHNILDINEIRKGFLKPKVQDKIVTRKEPEWKNQDNNKRGTKRKRSEESKSEAVPVVDENFYIDAAEIADNNDPRWRLFSFSEPRECFQAVSNQWCMEIPDPHQNLTQRFVLKPCTPVNIDETVENSDHENVLSVYEKQLSKINEEIDQLRMELDRYGATWTSSRINKRLENIQQLYTLHDRMHQAWSQAHLFYYNFEKGDGDVCRVSKRTVQEAIHLNSVIDSYKTFYGV